MEKGRLFFSDSKFAIDAMTKSQNVSLWEIYALVQKVKERKEYLTKAMLVPINRSINCSHNLAKSYLSTGDEVFVINSDVSTSISF